MKKYVIFGTNGMAKDICNIVESDNYEMDAFVLDKQYIKENTFYGKKVVAYEDLEKYYDKSEITILVMIGYSKMNETRKRILEKCKADGWDISSFIHSNVHNLSKSIGEGNIIGPFCDLGTDVVIGDGNVIGTHSMIGHDSVVANYNFFSSKVYYGGDVKVGNNNFFGSNCIIENGVEIEDYNLIAAGACLSKSLKSHMLVAPQPVRVRSMNVRGMDLLLMKKLDDKS